MPDYQKAIVDKIQSLPELQKKIAQWKDDGQKVVFTNGVFDLVHTGHITYLAQAAALGNKLIVGLNSDGSVKRLKGKDRPINDESSRALLLAAFMFVDAVIVFSEDTPAQLIGMLLPNLLVKGADYGIENIAGAKEVFANGGEVKTISLVNGFSSTAIINKIKAQTS